MHGESMMFQRSDDRFLAEIRSRLYVSVVSDLLDALGHTEQAMAARIRPLDDALVLVGYARTGVYNDVYHVAKGENPYELEIALIDGLARDEVPVFACGASGRIAPWGELLSTAARARAAAGCITDGLVRDVRAIRDLRFPVFHGGIAPLDSKGRGKLGQIDVPIVCAGCASSPATWSSAMPTVSSRFPGRSSSRSWPAHSTRWPVKTVRGAIWPPA
jgi:regulator of RNase E activity RraA